MNLLSVIIPAKNEAETIVDSIINLVETFENNIEYEIFIVNDYSDDNTEMVLGDLSLKYSRVFYANNTNGGGVGNAIKFGIEKCQGDVIAICMADGSDAPTDVADSYKYIQEEKFDCVFGSRFIKNSYVENYPFVKKVLNRVFNYLVKVVSKNSYNDFTNIFKVYKREVIQSISPINSDGFSIGLEMSLKAFKKGYRIKIIPISWRQRKAGKSKLNLVRNITVYFQTLIRTIK